MKEGYYRSETRRAGGRKTPKGEVSLGWSVSDVVMLAFTAVAAVALLCALLAGVVNPNSGVLFAFAGLFYPIIWVANLFCAFWWAARWKKHFVVPVVMLLIGSGSMGLFYRSDVSTKPQDVTRERNDIVVVTYNVMNFRDDDAPQGVANFDRVAEWINTQSPQVVMLQEAHFSGDKNFDEFRSKIKRLPYGYFVNAELANNGSQSGSGFVLLSAYPIVRRGVASSDSLQYKSLWADLRVGRDTVRVVNNHLQSTGITEDDRATTLTHKIVGDSLAQEKLTSVADKMKQNYQHRADQADRVAEFVASSPHPVIMAGDFNDTPKSYVYRTLRRCGLTDAFVEKGRGVEHTFKGLFNLFRIDYVMASEEHFAVKEYASHDEPMSDHKPLTVRLGTVL